MDGECVCRTHENCKSLILQDKCNIEIFLSPGEGALTKILSNFWPAIFGQQAKRHFSGPMTA